MSEPNDSERAVPIERVTPAGAENEQDCVAVEEPMEIRIAFGAADARQAKSLSITMRTPGHDFELAAGFLFTEGILTEPAQIRNVEFCGPPAPGRTTSNIVRVDLAEDVALDMQRLQRHFFTTSSCGICGKASLDALHVQGLESVDSKHAVMHRSVVYELPQRLRSSQAVFDRTGGLHAAGFVDVEGKLLDVREDVGRHNAVDKLIGRRFLDGATPLADHPMVISGRASFEILQKALVGGVSTIVAVGAPSSLAVDMARRFGMTLIGFASDRRFNIYAGAHRILP
ncbi:MAG: formate dehydrogenase accessory sulfurtransferase FdhD [bacterium]|nr:formate dehydrogenase accessory sulfurtransferase FdhD [bacterium]